MNNIIKQPRDLSDLYAARSLGEQPNHLDYEIPYSGVFTGSEWLQWLPDTPENASELTISLWAKFDTPSTGIAFMGAGTSGAGQIQGMFAKYTSGIYLDFYDFTGSAYRSAITTSGAYRDTGTWAHYMVTVDLLTGVNKLYVDGIEITTLSTNTVTVSSFISWLQVQNHYIGALQSAQNKFIGRLTEIHVLPRILLPTDFGQRDFLAWKPKKYEGNQASYGTNGFYIPDPSTGIDMSGNDNHFTVNGTIKQSKDTPTRKVGRWNALSPNITSLTEGATRVTCGGTNTTVDADFRLVDNTYWEVSPITVANWSTVGFVKRHSYNYNAYNMGQAPEGRGYGWRNYNGFVAGPINTSTGVTLSTWSTANRLMFAYNAKLGAGWMGKDGVWENGATYEEIEAGNTTHAIFVGEFDLTPAVGVSNASGGSNYRLHEGDLNQVKYRIPSGYNALLECRYKKEYFDPDLSQHYEAFTYNAANKSLVGTPWVELDGQPSDQFWWFKTRTNASHHAMFTSVRGPGKLISSSNPSVGESTYADTLTAFNVDGADLGVDANNFVGGVGTDTIAYRIRLGRQQLDHTGTIPVTVSVNRKFGISSITFDGAADVQKVPHGLPSKPRWFMVKNLTSGYDTVVYTYLTGAGKYLYLSGTAAAAPGDFWNYEEPTDLFITLGANVKVNGAGQKYEIIAFCNSDFIEIGTHEGNSSTDGTYISVDGTPQFSLMRGIDGTRNWILNDKARSPTNPVQNTLFAESSSAEDTSNIRFDYNKRSIKGRFTGDPNIGETYVHLIIKEPALL